MEDKETVTLLPGQTIIGTKYTKSSYVERLEQENAELKAENEKIKTSYINFIAKLKREMITKDDIQDLKDTAKRFVEERNSLKAENEKLKEENYHYKAELKLSFNELIKSEKWQVFERRKKNEYCTALNEIEKLLKKEYTRPVFRNCFGEYPKECKRCLHNGSCLQQQVLNIINSTKAEGE